jgi:murein DD-endopeptidase MepM/ murein hydrolase activator NlpD
MSQIATDINEEQQLSLLSLYEKEVIEKESFLNEIRDLIFRNSEEPVEDLLSLESEYLTAELALKNAKLQLEQIKVGKTEIHKSVSNVGQLKYELNKKNNRVKTQKSKVEKATSFPEIGNCQMNKYPLAASSYITSDFGKRTDPIAGEAIQFHAGIDLHAATDTKVICAYNGTVEKVGFDKALGYFVLVDHGKGLKTIYGHLNSYIVNAGDSIAQYQHIAYSGNSGSRSTGPHLHFGVYIYGAPVDPKVIVKR